MVGSTISHYKILEKLGEGGMGVVFKAEDTTLKRIVALKFLPEHVSASETDKARFLLEAQAAAALNHPNICTIYGIEETDGKIFIAMEFIDGQTLNLKRDSVNLHKAIDIGIQIADGLAAAHEKGIVHRDIKPENIMVRKDGIAQIMDFGLAKLRASRASRLTKEGSTVGTAGFMSPEQIQGQDTDHRSDIFSLGVLLYELLTGELPFKGVHETALLYEIVNVDPVPMSTVKQEIDPELDRIVLECLQKDPDERYNSVKDIAKDLKRFKRESSRQRMSRTIATRPALTGSRIVPATPQAAETTGLKRFIVPALIAIAIFAGAFMLGKFLFESHDEPKEVIKFEISLPPGEELDRYIDISPDGKQIAYIGLGQHEPQVYLRSLSDLDAHPVSGTEGANFVFFSPNGDWIGFESNGSIKKISVRGGTATSICVVNNLRGVDWGTDNSIIYAPMTTTGLWRISADGGTSQIVTTLDSSAGEISHRFPEILPGGKAVLFTVKTNSITKFSEAKIAVQKIGESGKKILIDGGSFVKYIPTGHLLYGQGGSIYAVAFDPESLELKGSPERVLDGGMFVESHGTLMMTVSNTGTIVYAHGGPWPQDSSSVLVYDRKGTAQSYSDIPGGFASIAFSPDRKRFASYVLAANDDIWLYDLQRHLPTRFTFAGGNNWYPLWSLDGKHIVYTAERGTAPNLFWKPTDGSTSEERLTSGPFVQTATSWSPDGKLLAFFQGNTAGNTDIWILPMDGKRTPVPFLQTKFNEQFATFSPDGRWITYSSDESGTPEIFAAPYPNGNTKLQISIGGGEFPFWIKRNSGEEIIYYNFARKAMMRVPMTLSPDVHPERAEIMFTLPDHPYWRPDVSPDGEHIGVVIPGKQTHITKLVVVANWFEELKKQFAAK